MAKLTVNDLDVRGKRVFVRVDFNVPMVEKAKDGEMVTTDVTRIKETLPTLDLLIQKGAKIILAAHLRRRVVLSEALGQASATALRQANRRHDVVAVQIADRYEMEMPALGRLVLKDAETGEVLEINTADLRKRAAFAQRQAQAQADLVRMFRSARIDAIQVRTGQPYSVELGRFFETREKRRLRG